MMDLTFVGAKALLRRVPLNRRKRVIDAYGPKQTKNVFAWAKQRDSLLRYKNNEPFLYVLKESLRKWEEVPYPSMVKRREMAHIISQAHFVQMMYSMEVMLSDEEKREKMFRVPGTFMPRENIVLYLLGMEERVGDLVSKMTEKVVEPRVGSDDRFDAVHLKLVDRTENGIVLGTIVIKVSDEEGKENDESSMFPHHLHGCYESVLVSVPVVIAPFQSFLNAPSVSWKSVSGNKYSTFRLYGDREGIHTSVLQVLDNAVEFGSRGKLSRPIRMKMIVVHSNNINLSEVKDIVKCTVPELPEMIASRLCGVQWTYCC